MSRPAATSGVRLLRREIRSDDLSGDPFGTAMGYWFAMAEALYRIAETVPESWEFSPSPVLRDGSEPEEYPDCLVWEWLRDGDVTPDDLRFYGNVLSRYRALLEREGRTY